LEPAVGRFAQGSSLVVCEAVSRWAWSVHRSRSDPLHLAGRRLLLHHDTQSAGGCHDTGMDGWHQGRRRRHRLRMRPGDDAGTLSRLGRTSDHRPGSGANQRCLTASLRGYRRQPSGSSCLPSMLMEQAWGESGEIAGRRLEGHPAFRWADRPSSKCREKVGRSSTSTPKGLPAVCRKSFCCNAEDRS